MPRPRLRRASRRAMVPEPFEVLSPAPGHCRHVDARAVPRARAIGSRSPPVSSRCSSAGGCRRGADLDQRRPGRAGAAGAHRARRRARDPGDLRRASRAACSACAGRSAAPGRSQRGRGRGRRRSPPAGSAWRRCARRSCDCSPGASATAGSCCSTAAALPDQLLYHGRARGLVRARARGAGDRRQRRAGVARARRRRHAARRPAAARPGAARSRCAAGPR